MHQPLWRIWNIGGLRLVKYSSTTTGGCNRAWRHGGTLSWCDGGWTSKAKKGTSLLQGGGQVKGQRRQVQAQMGGEEGMAKEVGGKGSSRSRLRRKDLGKEIQCAERAHPGTATHP